MKILEGLFDHMVLQRNRRNVSEAAFSGTCAGSGEIRASVKKGGRALKGLDDYRVGEARRGRFTACLRGLPAGGPYDVELRIEGPTGVAAETLAVRDVLVGDVWLLGGQSNMQGVGLLKHGPKPHAMTRAFYMHDRWAPAKEPIHNMWKTVDQVHIDLNGGVRPAPNVDWGVSPGAAFGHRMRELTGVPQGVIACAHGGTSMAQWDPKLKKLGTKSLYGAMIRRFRKNGAKVSGLVWYQGESDANADAAPLYTKRMQELVRALRRDCGDPNLPVAVVQISRVIGWPIETAGPWNSVQEQERRLPEKIRRLTVVPAIDLALDDSIHIGGRDQVRLGRRLAEAMLALTAGRKAGLPPIAIKKISVVPARGLAEVVVEFDHVAGRLRSGSRPTGFAIVGSAGAGANVFDVQLDRNRAIVRSTLPPDALGELSLHYGHGTDPHCTITDESDRSLPVFGPIRIGSARAITDFIRTVRVSGFQPSAGKLDALGYPKEIRRLGLRPRTFPENFCGLHAELGALAPKDVVVYYACAIECSERMRLAALLGYDGPVKMWVDGKKVFHDPNGINPATPGKACVRLTAAPGRHELLVALGSNKGNAWGIFLRIERLDVAARLVRKGPGHYAMPKILG